MRTNPLVAEIKFREFMLGERQGETGARGLMERRTVGFHIVPSDISALVVASTDGVLVSWSQRKFSQIEMMVKHFLEFRFE